MKIGRKTLTAFILSVLCAASLSAQPKPAEKTNEKIPELDIQTSDSWKFIIADQEFGLSEVLKYLLENNDQVRILLYDAAMSDTDSQNFKAKYMPVLFGEASYSETNYPEDAQTDLSGNGKDETSATVGIQKGFSTGTTVKAGLQQKHVDNRNMNAAYGDVEYYQNGYFFSVEQELVKNFFGYQERKQQKILKNAEIITSELTAYNMSLISVDAILSSWDYALAYSTFSNTKLKLDETRKVRAIIRSNVNLGVNEKYYLNYWNALVTSHELQFEQAEQSLKEKDRNLRIIFKIDENIPAVTTVLANTAPEVNSEEALERALKNRADYRKALLSVKNAKMQLGIIENDAMPSVKAGFSVSSMGERDGSSNAYDDAFANKDTNYSANITVSYPLFNVKHETDSRNAKMQLDQANINAENTRKSIEKDILNGIDAVNVAYDSYVKAKNIRIESELYYMGFKRQLNSGRFSAADLKSALDAMIDSRFGEMQALVYYNVTLLQFDIIQNSLFEKNNIDINEVIKEKRKSLPTVKDKN